MILPVGIKIARPSAAIVFGVAAVLLGCMDDDCLLALTHASGAGSLLWCSAAAPWRTWA